MVVTSHLYVCVCAGCAQGGIPLRPRRDLKVSLLALLCHGAGQLGPRLGKCTSFPPCVPHLSKAEGNPMGLSDTRGGRKKSDTRRVSHFLRLRTRWLFSAFIFPELSPLRFIFPWHLPQATLFEVLSRSAADQPGKAAAVLGWGNSPTLFLLPLENRTPPSLTLLALTVQKASTTGGGLLRHPG